MDRPTRLQEALEQARAAGAELLEALNEPVTPAVVDRVDQFVNRRDTAVRKAVELFQAGDQELVGDQLRELLHQQQALDAALRQFLEDLANVSQVASQVRSTVRGARQVMDAGRRGRVLDQKW